MWVTLEKKIRPRKSLHSCNTPLMLLMSKLRKDSSWTKATETTRKGRRILVRSKPPIRKGLKTATRARIDEGSKLLRLAMLPVAKKE